MGGGGDGEADAAQQRQHGDGKLRLPRQMQSGDVEQLQKAVGTNTCMIRFQLMYMF